MPRRSISSITSARAAFMSSYRKSRKSADRPARSGAHYRRAASPRAKYAGGSALPASTPATPAEVIGAGADGVAVDSGLSQSPDPAGAARGLRDIVDAMLAKRGA